MVLIDSSSKVKHYSGASISGICLNPEEKILFLAVPSNKYIIRNDFDDDAQDKSGKASGTQKKIFRDIEETSWINGLACTYSDQLYWFNSADQYNAKSNLYHANQKGKGSAALLVTGVETPSGLIKDYHKDNLYYVTNGQNVFEYELPPIDELNKISDGYGSITELTLFRDDVFIADS